MVQVMYFILTPWSVRCTARAPTHWQETRPNGADIRSPLSTVRGMTMHTRRDVPLVRRPTVRKITA